MNESGRSAGEAMRFYKLSPSDVIAIHDELDLKPGTVRVKTGGGNAGHNGLKSLSAYIGNDYKRVRLGIGHPGDKAQVIHYVLQDFAKADRQWLEPCLEGIARGMARLVEGSEAAFLSEAARGRAAPAAAKLNGAGAPATAKVSAAPPKIEATPADAMGATSVAAAGAFQGAGAARVASIQVVASREGAGGGAVSTAVMMPEPVRPGANFRRTGRENRACARARPSTASSNRNYAGGCAGASRRSQAKGRTCTREQGRVFGWWFRKRIRGSSGHSDRGTLARTRNSRPPRGAAAQLSVKGR